MKTPVKLLALLLIVSFVPGCTANWRIKHTGEVLRGEKALVFMEVFAKGRDEYDTLAELTLENTSPDAKWGSRYAFIRHRSVLIHPGTYWLSSVKYPKSHWLSGKKTREWSWRYGQKSPGLFTVKGGEILYFGTYNLEETITERSFFGREKGYVRFVGHHDIQRARDYLKKYYPDLAPSLVQRIYDPWF
jgi:hypothetical protein